LPYGTSRADNGHGVKHGRDLSMEQKTEKSPQSTVCLTALTRDTFRRRAAGRVPEIPQCRWILMHKVPALFLLRAGKYPSCMRISNSGRQTDRRPDF
jgi:hypothetical protein